MALYSTGFFIFFFAHLSFFVCLFVKEYSRLLNDFKSSVFTLMSECATIKTTVDPLEEDLNMLSLFIGAIEQNIMMISDHDIGHLASCEATKVA